jgi:hypothetical protein
MTVINAFFDFVVTWFGFVGSCFASPSGACVPFLAFLALGAAAAAALTLILLAYRSAMNREKGEPSTERRERATPALYGGVRARPQLNDRPAAA